MESRSITQSIALISFTLHEQTDREKEEKRNEDDGMTQGKKGVVAFLSLSSFFNFP